jgi:hypothetical protein
MPDRPDTLILQRVLGIGGGTLGIWSLMALAFTQAQAMGQARLLRGERVLARWRVDAALAEAFIARDDAFGPRLNDLKLRRPVPADGVAVIIGERSLQLGDDFRFLGSELWGVDVRPGPPSHLDFHMAFPRKTGAPVELSLRVPIALGHEAVAARVAAFHQAAVAAREAGHRPSVVERHPKRVRDVMLIVALVCAVAFAAGMLLPDHPDTQVMRLVAAVAGAVVGLGALLLALIAALVVRGRS